MKKRIFFHFAMRVKRSKARAQRKPNEGMESKAASGTGWLDLCQIEMVMLAEAGLSDNSKDRDIWRFAQDNHMILLTGNRNMIGEDSLEQTLREENTLSSLPVLTISRVDRLKERSYREHCAERLLEVLLDVEELKIKN